MFWAFPVQAISLIRDTEVEEAILTWVKNIFKAANLEPENARIMLVNDPSINAFVAGGQTIFVHTGLITQSKALDDLMFVLSHETGHIVGGHVTRGMTAYKNAQTATLISTILGGVIAVASGRPDAGIAVMVGSQSSALGSFLTYRQTEESSADLCKASQILCKPSSIWNALTWTKIAVIYVHTLSRKIVCKM